MSYLSTQAVMMGATADNKEQALAVVADVLVAHGFVKAGYHQALLLREAQANTYLGSGIAIPHGTLAYKEDVLNTGVVLVHFADGVDWGDGNMVYVAAGIAAKSDEHLGVLRTLARALTYDVSDKIKNAASPSELVAILQNKAIETKQATEPVRLALWGIESADVESLLAMATTALKTQEVVGAGFLTGLLTKPILQLTSGLWCVQTEQAVSRPAIVALSPNPALAVKEGQVSVLVLLAGLSEAEREAIVDKLLALPTEQSADLQQLVSEALSVDVASDDDYPTYHSESVVVLNRHGLHARPATALTKLASEFAGEVLVSANNKEWVSAKSLVRLLSLGAGYGQKLYLKVEPADGAKELLETLVQAIRSGLGEEVASVVVVSQTVLPPLDTSYPNIQRGIPLHGIVASAGLAVAEGFVAVEPVFEYERFSDEPNVQKELLQVAIMRAKAELVRLIANAKTPEIAGIFSAHQTLLEDDEIVKAVYARIDDGLSAAMAWHSEIEAIASTQAGLNNPLFAQRAADLKDVGRRVLMSLSGGSAVSAPDAPYVLIKDDLLPSDVVDLDDKVVAIMTAVGGVSSHGAIIARSLGLPALVGAGAGILSIEQGELVLVDALSGVFVIAPDDAMVEEAKERQSKHQQSLLQAGLHAHEPAKTIDGKQVEVMANLGNVADAEKAKNKGAEGIGLLRTEFVFMRHTAMPSEEMQIADYRQVFDAMAGMPVVARTLDVGGDKPLPYLAMKSETNPFLGVRGIRLSLQRPETLKQQLIALIVASEGRPLRIMFPMVGQLHEWYTARALLDEVLTSHPHADLQVGIMIEVPSAAILADKFAPLVDFFSIGTNDLTQYTLAVDRGHPILSDKADGLDPSVLRLIDMAVKSAHAHGKWVGVCGELGSDNLAVPVLLGLGVDELSVSASQIPLVKAQIRTLDFAACQALATKALQAESGQAVRALVKAELEA